MRLSFIILAFAAVAVGLVHLRRREIATRHEIQRLQIRRIRLRRELADKQVARSHLMTPRAVREQLARLGPPLPQVETSLADRRDAGDCARESVSE